MQKDSPFRNVILNAFPTDLVHVAAHHIARGSVVTGEKSLLHAARAVLGNPTTNLGEVKFYY